MFTSALLTMVKKWKQPKWWMDKWIVVHECNTTLFSHRQEWSTNARYTTNETWKHYVKWKNLDTKEHIFCDSIYIKCPSRQTRRKKCKLMVARGWKKPEMYATTNAYGVPLGDDNNVIKLASGDGCIIQYSEKCWIVRF